MGKIYGLHTLELRPGVTGEDFERFVESNIEQWPALPGWRLALLKGDRGDQVGQYVSLVEIDSIEARTESHRALAWKTPRKAASGSPWWDHFWSNGGSTSHAFLDSTPPIRTTTRSSGSRGHSTPRDTVAVRIPIDVGQRLTNWCGRPARPPVSHRQR